MRKAPTPETPRYAKRTEREPSRLGGVPKGSPSSAILQPTGSMIQSKATAVAIRPPRRRNKPKVPATIFAALMRLTLDAFRGGAVGFIDWLDGVLACKAGLDDLQRPLRDVVADFDSIARPPADLVAIMRR
jgi:hypothetical protein